MDGHKKVPSIRFKGFSDAWKQKKFGEWGDFYYGHSCPKWSVTEEATIPCIRYGELYTKFGTKINKVFSFTNMPTEKLRFSKGNEVLIPRVGEDPMDYTHCTWLSLKNVAIGEMISVFNTDQDPLFSATMFNATLKKEFAVRVEGGSVTNLYFEKLKNIDISYPTLPEQKKIATFFENIDNLITLHQQKYEKLLNVKMTMLEKMFPKEGEKVPDIRFKGFAGNWKQHKLFECAGFRRGSFPQPYGKKEWYDGENAMPFVQVADVSDDMKLVSDTKQKISKLAQPMSVYAKENSVLVTLQGSIGRVAITQYGAFVDRTVLIFDRYIKEIDKFFWAYIIKMKFIEEARKAPGGTIKTITKEALSDFDLMLPSYEEQKVLGTYLLNLDNLITLQKQKVEKLKNIKKAMLEKMFV